MGKGKVKVPPPSPEERQLQQQQASLLQQQTSMINEGYKQQQMLQPILLKQYGITPQLDANGNVVGYTQTQDPNQQLQTDIQTALLQRTKDALAGNLPVDAGTSQELDRQEAVLRENLRKQLGPGYDTSTPGIQALAEFNQRKSAILDAARRGDITMGEQLGLANQAGMLNQTGATTQAATALASNPYTASQYLSQNAAGYSNPLSYFLGSRDLSLRANMATSQANPMSSIMSGIGGLGQLAGTVMTSPYSGTLLGDWLG